MVYHNTHKSASPYFTKAAQSARRPCTRDFQAPWSYAGAPVVSLPCSLAADCLPAAVQLVGRWGLDWPLLQTAAWCEGVLDFQHVPPWIADVDQTPRA